MAPFPQLRVIFRVVEYSAGIESDVTRTIGENEVYQYCLDALPMCVALVAFNIIHPGRMFGKRAIAERQRMEISYHFGDDSHTQMRPVYPESRP
jgi:RTA1 like protein